MKSLSLKHKSLLLFALAAFLGSGIDVQASQVGRITQGDSLFSSGEEACIQGSIKKWITPASSQRPSRGNRTYQSSASKSETAAVFVETLNNAEVQARLMKLYSLDNEVYQRLFSLSLGILGAESKYGSSPKYWIKERFPWLVSSLKEYRDADDKNKKKLMDALVLGVGHETVDFFDRSYDGDDYLPFLFDVTENSRGPTQIKFLPEKLQQMFPEIDKSNLYIGANAAIATMAYLAEALPRMRHIARINQCELPSETEIEHLVYVYTGRVGEIVHCTATLEQNIYYQTVRSSQRQFLVQNTCDAI